MKPTILHDIIPATTAAKYATIDVFDLGDGGPPERFVLVCSRNGETYHSEFIRNPRDAAAAWLDAINEAEVSNGRKIA